MLPRCKTGVGLGRWGFDTASDSLLRRWRSSLKVVLVGGRDEMQALQYRGCAYRSDEDIYFTGLMGNWSMRETCQEGGLTGRMHLGKILKRPRTEAPRLAELCRQTRQSEGK
jgi:hypothetical protein